MIAQRLKAARLASGKSQEELGQAIGVSKMAISKYERGVLVPGADRLTALAGQLDVPVSRLLDPAPPAAVQPLAARARPLRGDLPLKARAAALARAGEWLERYGEAEEAAGVLQVDGQPVLLPVGDLDAVEAAAEDLRGRWSLGQGPIENVVDVLEDHCVPVMVDPGLSALDALAIVSSDGRVAVVVAQQPGDRQRFSLAHELAHIVLRPSNGLDGEDAAHRFAAAFLVPAATARRELGAHRRALAVDELRGLKRKYGFSMQAWVRRARELGIVSRRTAAALLGEMRACGWEEAEPEEGVRREAPARLERLVLRALAEDLITESRAAELLGSPAGSLRDRLRCA